MSDQKCWIAPLGSNPQPMAEGSLGANTPPPYLLRGMSWGCVFYTVSQFPYGIKRQCPHSGSCLAITIALASFFPLPCHSPTGGELPAPPKETSCAQMVAIRSASGEPK